MELKSLPNIVGDPVLSSEVPLISGVCQQHLQNLCDQPVDHPAVQPTFSILTAVHSIW